MRQFRIKGVVYRSATRYIDETTPGGIQGVLEHVTEPYFRRFLGTSFLASSWYDIKPLVALVNATVARSGRTFSDIVRGAAHQQAVEDTKGVYKILLKFTSPEQVIMKLPRVATRYFDFGAVTVQYDAERASARADLMFSGCPAPLLALMTASCETYVVHLMTEAGARDLVVRTLKDEDEGVVDGTEMKRIRYAVTWR